MEENYEELVDEAEDDFEQSQDIQDMQLDQYESAYPRTKEEQSIYNWFWKVVGMDMPFKMAKVGNLNSQEIGDHIISVRDALNLAHLGQIFHHQTFGNYWATRAKIVSASSMAKKGWFMELSISQKKVRERARSSASSESKKWRMFNPKPAATGA